MATCKACGEPIEFIATPKGRRMPVDPDVETFVLEATGAGDGEPLSIVLDNGQVIRGRRARPGCTGTTTVRGYVPHWDTCPQAEKFRRE
jgi:hypothetical protein